MIDVNDGLTKEQAEKREVSVENVDDTGKYKRQRVGQTIFDSMLLGELISISQNQAAHLFIEALSMSGASIQSVDIKARIEEPGERRPSNSGDRRMIFSSAYRSMKDRCDEDALRLFMRAAGDPFAKADNDQLKQLAKIFDHPLTCLAKYYKLESRSDPRAILRRQVRMSG